MKRFIFLFTLVVYAALFAGAQGGKNAVYTAGSTTIPKAFVGHWQKGVFSLSSFEEHNGKYVGPANETSVSYVIEANGNAKEYFISNINSYNCRTQILGFRQGKMIIRPADNSFEFRPISGYYTTLTCMSKSTTKKPYGVKDLYPAYVVKGYLKTDEDNQPVLVNERGLQLKKIK